VYRVQYEEATIVVALTGDTDAIASTLNDRSGFYSHDRIPEGVHVGKVACLLERDQPCQKRNKHHAGNGLTPLLWSMYWTTPENIIDKMGKT
jgi:hypothetical protein